MQCKAILNKLFAKDYELLTEMKVWFIDIFSPISVILSLLPLQEALPYQGTIVLAYYNQRLCFAAG